jgi:GNAT superfamily N-acetyltransferase/predicted nucleic acid-binding protein
MANPLKTRILKIEFVKNDVLALKQIQKLWRENSRTLGFFPKGAFSEYAWRNQILGAYEKNRNCVGYLLYRVSAEWAHIVHLCVHKADRGKGISRQLVAKLFNCTTPFKGVSLHCRRDFPASKIWPELGFVALTEKLGKNLQGKEITQWVYNHHHLTLFDTIEQSIVDEKLRIAIDASVFFDLIDENPFNRRESRALLADWLSPLLDISLTDEIFNEINRRIDSNERKKSRVNAQKFKILKVNPLGWEIIFSNLRQTFPQKTEQDSSDLRHLAKTLASGITIFVTRDGPLLKNSDIIFNQFGLSVVRPSDIVLRLNDLRMEGNYQPARFDRTNYQVIQVKPGQINFLTGFFQCSTSGEKKPEFKDYLGNLLAYPDRIETLLIQDLEANPICLFSFENFDKQTLQVPQLRIKAGPLAGTIARNLIQKALQKAANQNRTIVRFSDPYISKTVMDALKENGFHFNGINWIKITLPIVTTIQGALRHVEQLNFDNPQEHKYCLSIFKNLKTSNLTRPISELANIEKLLWPAKLPEISIPTYIIPIEPRWAQELFDEDLSIQNLFSSPPELGLNREAVYYRSKHPYGSLQFPGRILWYVSYDPKFNGTMKIRACSCIDEVISGKPKALFSQFRRLGVYTWKNIFDLAKKDINRDIMAIKFSYTESFPSPISWQIFQEILKEECCPSKIQSPHKITPTAFQKIYMAGTNRKEN